MEETRVLRTDARTRLRSTTFHRGCQRGNYPPAYITYTLTLGQLRDTYWVGEITVRVTGTATRIRSAWHRRFSNAILALESYEYRVAKLSQKEGCFRVKSWSPGERF